MEIRRTSDDDHTYGLVYRLYLGVNDKVHASWFASSEDAEKFEGRNAIVVLRRTRKATEV